MKRFLLFVFALCVAFGANAQDLPYSKYLKFTKSEFKENNFKYDTQTNTWSLRKRNGLVTTLNVLRFLLDASEDVRPGVKDYAIMVQMGAEEKAASVQVEFYSDETYHKVLSFLKENCNDVYETTSGKLHKHHAKYGDYTVTLNMDQHTISRTSARTIDPKAVKNVDESYNEYHFVIKTNVEPSSEYLDKQAAKQAKRDAKGKKKKNVDDLM